MGIIKAIGSAISGGLADQWLEVFEADDMGEQTVFTSGVLIRRGQNTKGTNNTVSNGSVIHVYDNQFMLSTTVRFSVQLPSRRNCVKSDA